MESGSIAESFKEDVKEPPEWLLNSDPVRDDRNRSLTLLKCPVQYALINYPSGNCNQ